MVPYSGSTEVLRSEEFKEKLNKGPVAIMTVLKNGPMAMGSSLVQWFVYCVIVGIFAAYKCYTYSSSNFCSLYCQPCPGTRGALPGGFPVCRLRCLCGLLPGTLAELHLVQAQMEFYLQINIRRFDICAGNSRNLWLAVARRRLTCSGTGYRKTGTVPGTG